MGEAKNRGTKAERMATASNKTIELKVVSKEDIVAINLMFKLALKQGYGKLKSMAITQAMWAMKVLYPNALVDTLQNETKARTEANLKMYKQLPIGSFDEVFKEFMV